MKYIFDLIVIGGGHAGVEAALVAKRSGLHVALITLDKTKTGRMSCNPAIGGIGKSHLAKEIDALGGYMAEATDLAGIQFRTLNKKKGPAVQATRAQTDKNTYEKAIQKKLSKEEIEIFDDEIKDFGTNKAVIEKAISKNNEYEAKAFVLTTGTFLNGTILIGHTKQEGGRIDEKKATGLEKFFEKQELKLGRLKTGTPPRLSSQTINYSLLEPQPGDESEAYMSFLGPKNKHPRQTSCHITQTNENTHKIIEENIKKSAMYSGLISGVGPRYCPSIEDKIVRFSEKKHHQIFVEPEGLETDWVYPNGVSTSLPKEVQEEYIRSIKGFEKAAILQYGYAVEYDYIDPRNLHKTLATKNNPNLFLAGQINGTTGYEEAGAQGIVAGINASLYVKNEAPWTPQRQNSYMGVLVDDLTRLGVSEPYRMFTSRAEHRLLLRQDNADERMYQTAKKLNIINKEREDIFLTKQNEKEEIKKKLQETKIMVSGVKKTTEELCKRNDFTEEEIKKITKQDGKNFTEVYFDIRYSGYIDKQQRELEKMKNLEEHSLGLVFDYKEVIGLSGELQERLNIKKPKNLFEASNIEGITPAALNVLSIHLKKIDALRAV
ncbi:MAG: tRNA uridine-5-carboxymethylaminomethyl(34) synthesis enzyme MnmG [Amoebophilaceae bacterium TMED152]|nr:tRNA uridine-5-carboxymethylaminomethyl(34) synthesis enzyme MnmG [Gammaproteobacteria bacterium]RPH01902.1 MAG: tRNA uridine-5-carboxymethylaminomethyl(34) synthesis enzyme MnmG [Amoebophilaceae bacterium TMED152]